ncbi:MAG: putative lipoprotein [Mucilaginibacter sp.]|nr:putative lipoprotein [Mucilaginibacter sp.]
MIRYIKSICLFIIFLQAHAAFAQIKVSKVDKKSIPKSTSYKGYIINAVRFTDNEGDHLVITTETGVSDTKGGEDGRDAELYAYLYNMKGNEAQLNWQTYDFVKDCPVDLEAQYIPNTFAITDLNKDGKAEVWLMYKTLCAGDISPGEMKIIMHEGSKKYAIRGQNKVRVVENQYDGGKYIFDEAFKNGPIQFKNYAQELWKKNIWGPKN